MSIRPTHITILEWGQKFSPPPHKNTICRWISQGLIQPPPAKVGRRWYLAENAEYVKDRSPQQQEENHKLTDEREQEVTADPAGESDLGASAGQADPDGCNQRPEGDSTTESACSLQLLVDRVYRAKKPKSFGIPPLCDDRKILHVIDDTVIYDAPSVKVGRRYPTTSREKFLAWADRDVTDELPEGQWGNYPPT
jgi:hypothetical protein